LAINLKKKKIFLNEVATPDIYNIQTMQPNANNPDATKSDVCYIPSAPMQSVSPPYYPMPGPALVPTSSLYPMPGPAQPSSLYPMPTPAPPSYPMTAPPPPPYGMSQTVQQSMYPSHPVIFTQMQVPYQGVIITGNFMPPQTAHINDYMVWSIINVFLGGFLLGIIAVLLSAQTRKRKLDGDVEGARTMSKLTLTCNVLITIIFFGLTAFLVIYYVIAISSITANNY